MFHGHAKALLVQMGAFQDHLPGSVEGINVFLSQLSRCIPILHHELLARDDNLLVNVLDEGLHEGPAHLLDSLFEPDIIM